MPYDLPEYTYDKTCTLHMLHVCMWQSTHACMLRVFSRKFVHTSHDHVTTSAAGQCIMQMYASLITLTPKHTRPLHATATLDSVEQMLFMVQEATSTAPQSQAVQSRLVPWSVGMSR